MSSVEFREPVVLAHAAGFRVGTARVDPSSCTLRNDAGQERLVEPRVMQVLIALARANGAPVTREELIAACWGGRVVSNDAVSRVISILRTLALDIGEASFAVETLNKVGYRLIEQPRPASIPEPAAAAPSRRAVIVLGGAAGVATIGGLWLMERHGRAGPVPPSGPAVMIVMPFAADASDGQLGAIASDASDSLRDDLDRVPGLRVIGGVASAAVAGKNLSAPQIAARTGATMALSANLDRAGGAMRAVLTLTDLASGQQLWSARVEAPGGDPAALRRDAAGAVIEQLVLRLPIAAGRPADASLRGDPEAYRLCNEARALCDEVRERYIDGDGEQARAIADRAAELVARALALQGEYAPALVILADLVRNGWSQHYASLHLSTQQRVDRAHGLLRRALRSDPTNSAAMSGLADLYRRFGWRWDDAETLFRHALVNDPGNADAHWAYSHQLATLGRARDGLEQTFALEALDWTHLWRRVTLPRMTYLLGLRDQALESYYAELGAKPGNPFLLWEIYYLHAAERSAQGLQRLIDWLAKRWQGRDPPSAVIGIVNRARAALAAMQGSSAALLAILDGERAQLDAGALSEATLGGRARDDIGFILTIEYACAGNYDRAIALLDQALAAKSVYWVAALPYGNAPFPAAMRADPRFQALWQRDPQLADAVDRRRQAALAGQMAAAWPDGRVTAPKLSSALRARIAQAIAESN
ncbi:hypothetical protein EAH87_09885 [Sphingomonas koreensis]|nr:hypothetical protein EAH87_09885 [Sphingomonas koreensis]